MQPWVWIVIVISSLIVIYALATLITWFLMKSLQKRTFKALDELVPYEKNRFTKIKEIAQALNEEHRIPKNSSINDTLKLQEIILSGSRIDMNRVKSQNDFLLIFLKKALKEKGLRFKEPFATYDKDVDRMIDPDSSKDSSPYYQYNKLAYKYNAYLGMMLIRAIAIRKQVPNAPIL
jgi:hypothetical protein